MLREEERKLDGKGGVKSIESRMSEVMILRQHVVERLLARNDKPLSKNELAREEERMQNAVARNNGQFSGFPLRKHLEQHERALAANREYMREVIAAYNYKLVGMENLNGRQTYVIDGEPRPQYPARFNDTKLLHCFSFRLWIDKADSQWVKLDARYTSFFPYGLFPVRLQGRTHVLLENTRVNDEIWLPSHALFRVNARVGLIKNFYEELEMSCRDYRKFRADTKITHIGTEHEKE